MKKIHLNRTRWPNVCKCNLHLITFLYICIHLFSCSFLDTFGVHLDVTLIQMYDTKQTYPQKSTFELKCTFKCTFKCKLSGLLNNNNRKTRYFFKVFQICVTHMHISVSKCTFKYILIHPSSSYVIL